MKKKALITGVTGQDGSYMAEFLLDKGYEVHGIKRRSSSFNTGRIDHIFEDPHKKNKSFFLHHGDLADPLSINNLVAKVKPDEIYNLAAQSHVAVSFEIPEYTSNIVALGTLRILESIKQNNLTNKTKFYQASSSELYGLIQENPQNENTKFYPRSPYATSKLFAYWITINYREAYNIYACNGILFNHESPRRGGTFVTKKITDALFKISKGKQEFLELGNLYALRDWGHAQDYVEAMWMMLQEEEPDDYVIATNKQYSVKDFIEEAAKYYNLEIVWSGEGLEEVGKDKKSGKVVIKVNEKYFRPTEVESLLGDYTKAKKKLGVQL